MQFTLILLGASSKDRQFAYDTIAPFEALYNAFPIQGFFVEIGKLFLKFKRKGKGTRIKQF